MAYDTWWTSAFDWVLVGGSCGCWENRFEAGRLLCRSRLPSPKAFMNTSVLNSRHAHYNAKNHEPKAYRASLEVIVSMRGTVTSEQCRIVWVFVQSTQPSPPLVSFVCWVLRINIFLFVLSSLKLITDLQGSCWIKFQSLVKANRII